MTRDRADLPDVRQQLCGIGQTLQCLGLCVGVVDLLLQVRSLSEVDILQSKAAVVDIDASRLVLKRLHLRGQMINVRSVQLGGKLRGLILECFQRIYASLRRGYDDVGKVFVRCTRHAGSLGEIVGLLDVVGQCTVQTDKRVLERREANGFRIKLADEISIILHRGCMRCGICIRLFRCRVRRLVQICGQIGEGIGAGKPLQYLFRRERRQCGLKIRAELGHAFRRVFADDGKRIGDGLLHCLQRIRLPLCIGIVGVVVAVERTLQVLYTARQCGKLVREFEEINTRLPGCQPEVVENGLEGLLLGLQANVGLRKRLVLQLEFLNLFRDVAETAVVAEQADTLVDIDLRLHEHLRACEQCICATAPLIGNLRCVLSGGQQGEQVLGRHALGKLLHRLFVFLPENSRVGVQQLAIFVELLVERTRNERADLTAECICACGDGFQDAREQSIRSGHLVIRSREVFPAI